MGGFLSDLLDKSWEGTKWLFDAPILKPIADELRETKQDSWLNIVPGYLGAKAIAGGISGLGGLAGAGIDKPRDMPIWDIPEIGSILRSEFEEGLPAATEQVAPIDILTLGLSGAASAVPKGIKGASALTKAAKVADVSEGAYGVENIGEGLFTGDLQKAGVGLLRSAGGLGGLIGGNKVTPELEPTPNFELVTEAPNFEPLVEDVPSLDLGVPEAQPLPATRNPYIEELKSSTDIDINRSAAEHEVRQFTKNIIDQFVKQMQGEEVGMGVIPDEGTRLDLLKAKGTNYPAGGESIAEFYGTKGLSESVSEFGGNANIKSYLKSLGELNINPIGLLATAKTPNDFVHNLVDTLSHELGHARTGQHPDIELWRQREQSPGNIANVPPEAQTMYDSEFQLQVQKDVLKQKLYDSPLIQNLLETSTDPNSPVSQAFNHLKVAELTKKFFPSNKIKGNIKGQPLPEVPKEEGTSSLPVEETIPTEQVVSEPANILRKILTETKLTRFNKNTLVKELEGKGIPVPEEVNKQLPELLGELKQRGWINEKAGGTYSLLIEPPKRVTELAKGKPTGTPEKDLESTLAASLEIGESKPVRTDSRLLDRIKTLRQKNPELSLSEARNIAKLESAEQIIDVKPEVATTLPTPKKPLTPDELTAIGKIFGTTTSTKKAATKAVSEEVGLARKAALEGGTKKSEVTGGAFSKTEFEEAVNTKQPEVEEGTKRSYQVTLSDGTTHRIKAKSPEAAQAQAKEVLTSFGSTKTVDKVEEALSSLQKAAKYEIEPVKQGTEEVKDIEAGVRATKSEEVTLSKEEEKLRKAQTKEKFTKNSYTVKLSNGEEVTVRARSEQAAKEYAQSVAKKQGSNVTVAGVTRKATPLEKAVGSGGKKPPKEPPKFGRESITPEDSFTQAWKKLSPHEMIQEVGGIIKAMRSSLDMPMLRQGKIMTIDFLTTGNSRELVNAIKNTGKSVMSEKYFNDLNVAHSQDSVTSKLVTDFGLDLPGIAGHLKEEAFHVSTAEKIPVLGKAVIKPSERAYTAFLNEARVSEAKRLVKIAEDAGFTMDDNPDVFKSLMKAVNIVGSRGDFKRIGPTLNNLSDLLWSPRLKASRAQLLTSAAGLGEMHPFVRAELRKSLGRTVAVNTALLGLASLAGANIETDVRNSDFMKIKIGDTRVDPWFGLQPIIRAVALMYVGERTSATTGQTRKVSPPELIGQQITSGVAPGPAYAYEQLKGESVSGYPIDRSERAILGVSPLIIEDVYDAMKQYGLIGISTAIPTFLGEGTSTYSSSEKSSKKKKKRNQIGY